MELRFSKKILYLLGALLCLPLVLSPAAAWGGLLRITMTDGTSVEVPYYWEEKGEVKFEIAGGVAGIPKTQVASVQEILTAKEFDPEVLLETPKDATSLDQEKALQELVASQSPTRSAQDKVSSEEGIRLLKLDSVATRETSDERISGPIFNLEGSFSELVRLNENEVMLVMRNIVSSRDDLKGRGFTLTLYDGEGNVLQKKSCELAEVKADPQTLKTLDAHGRLYSVTAIVEPDQKIKRCEITANRR